jgi:hypothetical protein
MSECSGGACGISCPAGCGCAATEGGSCSCQCYPQMLKEDMGTFDFTPAVLAHASRNKAEAAYSLDDTIEIDAKDAVLASLAEFLIPKDKHHAVAIPVGLIGKRVTSQEKSTTLRQYFRALGALFIE